MAKGVKTGGRVAGTPNRLTGAVKDMVMAALTKTGGVDYLIKQAADNPTAFMTLIGKLVPLEHTGEGGGPIQIQEVPWLPARSR